MTPKQHSTEMACGNLIYEYEVEIQLYRKDISELEDEIRHVRKKIRELENRINEIRQS